MIKTSSKEETFRKKISPTFNGKTFPLPKPPISPSERMRRRTAHRNEQYLHQAKSCFSGKPLISIYSSAFDGKICSREEWFGDSWDGLNFGRSFDFSLSFFENFKSLQNKIPRAATVTLDNENSKYTTGTGYCKNCYLINSSEHAEDSMYSKLIQKGKDIVDSAYIYKSELLYECFNCENCFDSRFLWNAKNCADSWFLKNCTGCKNCFGCVNLKQKEYYFLNEKQTPEAYDVKIKSLGLNKRSNLKNILQNFRTFTQKFPQKYAEIMNSEDCQGDFIINSKNCQNCYDLEGSQDCWMTWVGEGCKDVFDSSNIYVKAEMCLETLGTINIYNCNFCLYVFNSSDCWYCEQCFSCKNCFGCVGLRNKEYCIFNKQFSKEEYEKEVAKIIEHMQKTKEWGEFFPIEISPFGYNETLANTYFPMTKEAVWEKGWKWQDITNNEKLVTNNFQIPDSIQEVSDDVLDEILSCEDLCNRGLQTADTEGKTCNKPYKIQKAELDFYRKMNLPVPNKCPDCRHIERMKLRNPRQLWDRKCDKCSKAIQTTFAPNRPEKVYCEKCYLEYIG